ncbi:MAG: hypothetical protein JWM91_3614 [Rhodospirillales bacterium]|nr:hypothetical protein [Rhodospirillales bacterium]
MAKLLLIVCALFACGVLPAHAQTATDIPPPARLIKPRPRHVETHPAERIRHPLDDRCRPLKDQLELELQKNGNQRRQFQARLAHNAGTRLCREGRAEKGIAELQRGLSYLQDFPH